MSTDSDPTPHPTPLDANRTGHIGRDSHESTPWFEPPQHSPGSSPNVIYIVFDDVGYSDFGCYGSEIRTPNIDSLAGRGLRYANFHTTTLCSPTRACLLTGRNHHSVGMRFLSNYDMGWPSGRGAISSKAATLAETLREHGYGTYAVGKWHLAPTDEASAAGPFGQWPLGRGFDRFYGFMNGSTDQYQPDLIADNHCVDRPTGDDYHLTTDLIDKAIGMLANQVSLLPNKPFFMNLALGAGHWPHQVERDYLRRYEGIFDAGWDVIRAQRLERQKAMGLVPLSTQLPASNPGVVAWDSLSSEQKKVALRLQQAYAGFLEHADEQVGRLMAFLERIGKRENTLIVLLSDNGASTDCAPEGTTNILRWFNGLPECTGDQLAQLESIGGPGSCTNYPWGWAQVSNTPTRLYKGNTHGGGVRDPLIVSWPARIAKFGLRHQFLHAIDLVPTVLEVCGLKALDTYRGVPQMPVHGTSFAYTFNDALAETRKEVQYFEMYGHRGIWYRGWKAVTCHTQGVAYSDDQWELYRLDEDFAEVNNLAQAHPAMLRELIERWWAEAGKYDVMPLDDRRDLLFNPQPKFGSIRAQKRFVLYPGIAPIPAEAAPLAIDVSHRIEAEVVMDANDHGALLCFGNRFGGYGLFVIQSRLVYAYNRCGDVTVLRSAVTLPSGNHHLAFEFERLDTLAGNGRLLLDGEVIGETRFEDLLRRPTLASMHIGSSGLPVLFDGYEGKFNFSGRIERVVFEISNDGSCQTPSTYVD